MEGIIARLTRLESLTGVSDATSEDRPLLVEVRAMRGELDAFQASVGADLLAHEQFIQEIVGRVERELARLGKSAVGGTSRRLGTEARRFKVPEPTPYKGNRNAKELENFLWDMENYFMAAAIEEADQVMITTMYLAGDAKLWWRQNQGREPRIETFEALKSELKDQFLPQNAEWVAKEALRKLQQTGSVREYVREYSSLILDIRNMHESDKLFNFVTGLQPWAQAELRRHSVKDVQAAIAVAEGLVDFNSQPSVEKDTRKEDRSGKPAKGEGKWKKPEGASSSMGGDQSQRKKTLACFICGGPHFARECKEGKVSSLRVKDAKNSDGDECARVNPIQLINAISSDGGAAPRKGLMFIDVLIQGSKLRAMLDTGATNNFISEVKANELGLEVAKSSYMIKAVNSGAQRIKGVVKPKLQVGEWQAECPLMVIPLEDYELILGLEFFRQAKAVVMPHLGVLMIQDESSPYAIKSKSKGGARSTSSAAR